MPIAVGMPSPLMSGSVASFGNSIFLEKENPHAFHISKIGQRNTSDLIAD